MTPLEALKTVLTKKYATFSGRASRSEFWWFSLFSLVATIAGMFLMMAIAAGILSSVPMKQTQTGMHFPLGALFFILILLALFLPSLAVSVRRLHDLNYSGWWVLAFFLINLVMNVASRNEETNGGAVGLLALIDICINIGVIIFLAQPGSTGSNRFGPDPLASDRSGEI